MKLPENDTDANLLACLRAGDRKSFETIYRIYVPELYRFARKNIQAQEDCEEIVQDVFESLWVRHAELYVGSIRQYLFGSARYKIARYFKNQAVKNKYAEHYRWFAVLHENMDKEEFNAESAHAMIMKKIAELPERCQMVIRLRITENLSYNEIARRMQITTKTVEMHMGRAFCYLRASCARTLLRRVT